MTNQDKHLEEALLDSAVGTEETTDTSDYVEEIKSTEVSIAEANSATSEMQPVSTEAVTLEGEQIDEQAQVIDISDNSALIHLPSVIFGRLSHKNQQFMLALDKNLSDAKLTPEIRKEVYTEMAETLIDGQKQGVTARQLYGTPTEAAATVMEQNFPTIDASKVKSPDSHIYLDGALLLGSIFAIVTGLTSANGGGALSGLLAVILNYIMAGFVMLVAAKYQPNPEAPKGQRGWGKYFLFTTLSMAGWYIAIIFAAGMPKSINLPLTGEIFTIIGVATLLLRFYLKKKLNIRGTIF